MLTKSDPAVGIIAGLILMIVGGHTLITHDERIARHGWQRWRWFDKAGSFYFLGFGLFLILMSLLGWWS